MPELTQSEQAAFAAMREAVVEEPKAPGPAVEIEDEEPPQALVEEDSETAEIPEKEEKPQAKKRYVPHEALHEERLKRQQAERDLAVLREREARLDERLRFVQEMEQQRTAATPPEKPLHERVMEDPVNVIEALALDKQQRDEQMREWQRQSQEEQQRQAQWNEFGNAYKAQTDAYAKKEPAFRQAYEWLSENRFNELKTLGYDDATAVQVLRQDEVNIAAQAMRAGINPGERLMELARYRGWTGKAPEDADDKVEKIAKAQRDNASLSASAGGGPAGEMTIERLLAMPQDAFYAWTRKNPKKFERLRGK